MPVVQDLVLDEFGLYLGKRSERLQVMRSGDGTPKERMVQEAPLMHLETVTVSGRGISLSVEAIQACTERGIPIFFLDGLGRPYASLYSAGLTGTILTRRAQLAAAAFDLDKEACGRRGVAVALAFAEGKIRNQCNLLRYMGKYRKASNPALFQEIDGIAAAVSQHVDALKLLGQASCVDQIRSDLLGIEGRAAQCYWSAVKQIVPSGLAWPGRRTRRARDPLNSALNYGYGILYSQVERALVLAGLDPYGGFIHVDRPGKPSLVLDLIEEFRQAVVDRAILALANQHVAFRQGDDGMLDQATRRTIADKVLARLDAHDRFERKRLPLRTILQRQARHLATFLRGERDSYEPFVAGW